MPKPTVTVIDEDTVVELTAAPAGEALWVDRAALVPSGWEEKPAGLCRGPLCIPIPADRRAEVVRGDAVDLAALARLRGQVIVHDDDRSTWVFGVPGSAGFAGDSVVAPDFALPDLAGRVHSLAEVRGRKVLVASWASW
jgi:hypothetical protein